MSTVRRWRTGLLAASVAGTAAAAGWAVLGDASTALPTGPNARPVPVSPAARPAATAEPAAGADLAATAREEPPPAGVQPASSAAQTPNPAPARPPDGSVGDRRAALAGLDTALIPARVGSEGPRPDAFAAKSWFVAPPPPPPPPPAPPPPAPPPPQAPPLPFKYIGMLQESADRTVWYLTHGERLLVAATGDVVDATYRIDGVDKGQLQFTYLPLDQRQMLAIGGSP